MLPGIPIGFRGAGRFPSVHATPTVLHCSVAARPPAPARIGSASLALVHGYLLRAVSDVGLLGIESRENNSLPLLLQFRVHVPNYFDYALP
jgi:hypothetical protein